MFYVMNLFFILCFLPFALSSPLDDPSCGKRSEQFLWTRIIGGRNVSEGEFPWTVSLGKRSESMNKAEFYKHCGGAILSKRTVITAAHCFLNR